MSGISGRPIIMVLASLALAACGGNRSGNNGENDTAAGATDMGLGTGMNASSTIDMANAGTTMNAATDSGNNGGR